MSNPPKIKIKRTTPEFRVSYPHVFKPHAVPGSGQEPKYSVTMLLPKTANLDGLKSAITEALTAKFGADRSAWPKIRNPIRDGDGEDFAGKKGYQGNYVLSARTSDKPGVIDASGNEIINEGDFYGGCYAKATVVAFWYEKAGNKGVAFALNNLLKTRDGEPFGQAKADAASDFKDDLTVGPSTAPAKKAADDDIFG
jgi:hypothetical protein